MYSRYSPGGPIAGLQCEGPSKQSGGGKPTPMLANEVARIIQTEEEETDEAPKLDIRFAKGDKVKVKEGNFESFEGEVNTIDEASGRVTVMINIFGRSTPVELEYWQIEAV